MKLRIAYLFTGLVNKVFSSIKRFPVTLFIALVTAILLIYQNHNYPLVTNEIRSIIKRLAMVSALGIPISLCVKMFLERRLEIKKYVRVIIYLVLLIPLIYFYYLLKDESIVSTIRYIGFTLVFYVAFTFIPYFYRRNNYEMYVVKLFTNFFITYLYSIILYGGLSAIIFTIDKLFNINMNGKVYVDILILVGTVFAPAYFLSSIPRYEETIDASSYSKVLNVLIMYIITPITIAYSIIMYAFFIKIIITGIWPNNLISNLVLWYSLISILVIFFIYPLKNTNKFTRNFVIWFPRLILPIILMMFISMGIRINVYGITEPRYLVMIAGIWVFINMTYIGFGKNIKNIFLTVSLVVFSIVSVLGPFSSYSISKSSQNNRFEKILQKNDMIINETVVKISNEISENDNRDLTSIIYYFDNNHKLKDLKYLPENFNIDDIEKVFGFKPDYNIPKNNDGMNNVSYYLEDSEKIFSIEDYTYFIDYNNYPVKANYNNGINSSTNDNLTIVHSDGGSQLKIMNEKQEIYKVDINEVANKISEKSAGKDMRSIGDMTFTDENDKIKIKLVFKNIYGSINNNKMKLLEANFYIFIKLK
jgi:hypothetical protein